MKYRVGRFLYVVILLTMFNQYIFISEINASSSSQPMNLVDFKFDQKNLQDILNEFAQLKGINIVYPETDSLTAKVTFDAGKKITITEAWEFLAMILDQAGFSLIPHSNNTYRLISNKKFFTESVPLYINVDYRSLPDSTEKIRYVYYFNNIQLSIPKQQADVMSLLKGIIGEQDFAQQYIPDVTSNYMILTTKSQMIKTIMELIAVLDEPGFREAVELVKLEYAQAAEVVKILSNMISGSSEQPKGGSNFVSLSSGQRAKYFSEHAKIVNMDVGTTSKFNSVILMGKTEDVQAIKDFIKKYLDVAQQQGKSFFHVIELEWLQASNFVTVLRNLIQGRGSSGTTGQSTSTPSSQLAFDPQIQIVSEQQAGQGQSQPQSQYQQSSTTGQTQTGGNRLIIAAPEKDWKRIDALIKEVDVPQKQVAIEALVMDLDLSFTRTLASQIRTKGICPSIFPKDMQAQAALISDHQLGGDTNDQNLLGDLSKILSPDTEETDVIACSTPANTAGMTTFMINSTSESGKGVWAFFRMLSQHNSAKVLTRPLVLATNNKQATLTSAVTKQLAGNTSAGAIPTVNYQNDQAPIKINFTPIISENDAISLDINIELSLWANAESQTLGTKFKRNLTSKLAMKSGDTVILGGLTIDNIKRTKHSVPFIEKIPLVGNLFANRSKTTEKAQLFILIRPTVVAPQKEGGTNKMTDNAMHYIKGELGEYEDAFANLKDPITRWFFDDTNRQSNRFEEKIMDLGEVDLKDTVSETGDIHLEAHKAEEKPLQVEWITNKNLHAKPKVEQKKNKNMDNLSAQLKDAVNPFQRLEL